ncbi:MAG TPA: DoxX family protein [Luteimonas sp.]
MRYALLEKYRDGLMLTARVLLVVLFVKFGLAKAVAFAETSAYMASTDLPVPSLMSLIAVAIELGVGLAIAIGFYTRPLALLLGIYTLIAAVIGHPYWHMSGELQYESMINFYKNISIAGGLLLLVLTGPGAYSLDRK